MGGLNLNGPPQGAASGGKRENNPLWAELGKHWKLVALRGVAALVFGVLTLLSPALALTVLVLFWGAYALVDGVLALIAAFNSAQRWQFNSPLALVGVIGVAAGLVAFFWPQPTAIDQLLIIAGWRGDGHLPDRRGDPPAQGSIQNEWWMIPSGAISVLFGVLMDRQPRRRELAVGLGDQRLRGVLRRVAGHARAALAQDFDPEAPDAVAAAGGGKRAGACGARTTMVKCFVMRRDLTRDREACALVKDYQARGHRMWASPQARDQPDAPAIRSTSASRRRHRPQARRLAVVRAELAGAEIDARRHHQLVAGDVGNPALVGVHFRLRQRGGGVR